MGQPLTTPPIRAAGGVLWRTAFAADGSSMVEVALIHRPRYDDWSLPKGKLAPGEAELEGAVREVLEETGHRVRVGRSLGETRYLKANGGITRPKVVRWWAMEDEGGIFSPSREVDDLRWLSLADAADQLTRESDREILEAFVRGPAPTSTVLVVRHATAGSRATWTGPDELRPLDDCGRAQADELVRILARFDAARIVSAPPVRCIDTVRPLADALSLRVEPAPILAADEAPGRMAEAAALIRELGGTEHDAVACSQGEVIPDLVTTLASADHVSISTPVRSRKGSVWALTFDTSSRLVAADYLSAPRPEPCPEASRD
jgi:8-oxo-(d)GTP phosphatase